MKSPRDESTTEDANLWRERRVDGCGEDRWFQSRRRQIHMRALPERVDSGIRSSGAMHAQLLANDFGKGALDSILNGVAARLALPA